MIFIPYSWNNSNLPSRLISATYAALFRLAWSLVLAYIVISCAHKKGPRCYRSTCESETVCSKCRAGRGNRNADGSKEVVIDELQEKVSSETRTSRGKRHLVGGKCFCTGSGNLMNRFLSLDIFSHFSRLAFVAYLIHMPMMSVFVAQTRGLFAFSHSLVIHLAISYLVLTFVLSFILVHLIEFPFITFERLLFHRLYHGKSSGNEQADKVCESVGIGQESNANDTKKRKLSFTNLVAPQSKCYNVNGLEEFQETRPEGEPQSSLPEVSNPNLTHRL